MHDVSAPPAGVANAINEDATLKYNNENREVFGFAVPIIGSVNN